MNARKEFQAMLAETVYETGVELGQSSAELAEYMAERADHLALISHEPGFGEAVRREASSVALRAGLNVSDAGRAADHRLFGMVAGALRVAAVALAR